MDYDVADDYPPHAGDMENQIRTAEFIRKARPLFIADVQKVATIDKFPIFLDVIEELYAPEILIHGSRIYRLRNSEAGISARQSAMKPIYGTD